MTLVKEIKQQLSIFSEEKAEEKTEKIDPADLKIGDTIILNGKEITISKNTLKQDKFMGLLINGQRVTGKIKRVLFPKWSKGKLVGYVSQV